MHGNGKGFDQEVAGSEMSRHLGHLGISVSEPKLGQEPILPGIKRGPDGAVWTGSLPQLYGNWQELVIRGVVVEKCHRSCQFKLGSLTPLASLPACWDTLQDLEVNNVGLVIILLASLA